MATVMTYAQLAQRVGQELGVSSWRQVDQPLIDQFAAMTGDDGFPHVDPVRAAATPFGGTIAHGLLVLGLFGGMAREVMPVVSDRQFLLAYGWDRIRFTAPVKTGSRIRGRIRLEDAQARSATERMLRLSVRIEIEGAERAALVGDLLQLVILKGDVQ